MSYTVLPEGNLVISKDMDRVREVLKGTNVTAVLFGSYGRGEGAFIDGKPRNDYDLLINSFEPELKAKLEKLQLTTLLEVHQQYITNPSDISCTQQWYEIKYGSKLINGKPLGLPDWQAYEIPYADAVNSINRRSVSMILGKYEMMKEDPDYRKVAEQIVKGIIALGDAQLIKRGEFHHLYTVRSLMLIPDEIGRLYQTAVSIKLLNQPQLNPDELWQLWEETRARYRQYIVDNSLRVPNGELLINITERHDKETIKKVLIELGAGQWLGDDTK
ncbi:MAG: hypothetical protein A2612_01540 [Candidatus Moranbacteria bacterium RIFOXYD1_FULL_44_12]|nr:MAG: hypothetical protein A2612_01540 [Candidatus Moranbacteria bacterium RIFOXYD1_FULL_44_12]OGK67152.1 MAG: hypothetical protein A2377_00760 [Candidatus Roizmanbacteria bacterium RIFOXYB1_FULL_41_27]